MKRLQWILISLLSAIAPFIIGVTAIYAAYLNDIRVGEYETHTRIVFELSETTAFERIVSRKPGQLTIIFANTQPQLARKIPIERTKRVKAVRLLSRKDSLSLILSFSFDHFRYELQEYKNPFRIVVDVFHLPSGSRSPPASEIISDQATGFDAGDTLDQPFQRPLPSAKPARLPLAEKDDSVLPAGRQSAESLPPAASPQPTPRKTMSGPPPSPPAPSKGLSIPETDIPDFKGLQYYLVVGMVIMTIIILILLLLMLIFKQPESDDQASNTDDDLLQQDKRIAAIDAKIHEQLKRYDDA